MDTSGFSQVGRYGTLSLLKKRTSVVPGNGGPAPSQVVTSFGIDNINLTFGRASSCDVRLYYPSVDPVHCTVVNEDGKAFLAVHGKSGALVDGCWVYPHSSSSSSRNGGSGEQQQSIIPLSNNSEFEIHGKRFRFTYPPKEVRKVLLATPVAQRNRKLRLSMIQSAQVFSPRPSHDPRENLRILQSPIKTSIFGGAATGGGEDASGPRSRSQSPTKPRAVSPLKFGIRVPSDDEADEDEDNDMEEGEEEHDENAPRGRAGYFNGEGTDERTEDEDHIVLVHTSCPRVVEEERDLVILEDVPLHLILPSPSVYSSGSPVRPDPQRPGLAQPQPQPYFSQPQPQAQPPSTPPRRRSMGGNALHRAVLIRSAQRAVWKAEKEREELEEEMEVLGAVVDPVDVDDVSGEDEGEEEEEHVLRGRDLGSQQEHHRYQNELKDVEMRSVSDEDDQEQLEELDSTEEEDDEEDAKRKAQQKPLWRKSIEKIIPWRLGGMKEDNDEYEAEDQDEDSEGAEEENDAPAPLPVRPLQQERLTAGTPARRPLGSFMTPQPQPKQQPSRKDIFPSSNATVGPTPTPAAGPAATAGPGRYSLGGGEARRVIIQQPWKVKDLVVPPVGGASAAAAAPPLRAMDPPGGLTTTTTFTAPTLTISSTVIPGSATKPVVTEEERRAIQERRRSAARELKTREDAFWKDGAPGMMSSPAKSPAKAAIGLGVGHPSSFMAGGMTPSKKPLFGSPTKGSSLEYSIKESDVEEEADKLFLDDSARSSKAKTAGTPRKSSAGRYQDDDEESLDTNTLLERMRETVESMKQRRRSSVARATPKPQQTGLFSEESSSSSSSNNPSSDSTPAFTPARATLGSVKKIDFTRIYTPGATSTFNLSSTPQAAIDPGKTIPGTPVPITPPKIGAAPSPVDDTTAGDEPDTKELEPFSLLRPGVARPSLASLQKEQEEEHDAEKVSEGESGRPVPVPVVVVDAAAEEEDEPEPEVKTRSGRGKPRLWRAPKTKAQAQAQELDAQDEDEDESEETLPKPKPSSSKANSRIKPPPSSSTKPRSRSAARSPAPEPAPAAELTATESGRKRRQRSRTPQPRPSPEEAEPEPEQAQTRSGGARRTRKGNAEPEEPPVVTPATVPAQKNGRKGAAAEPVAELEEEEATEEKPPPVKRGRKPRSAAAPAPAQEEEPVPALAPVKRSRSKKAKELEGASPAVAEDNEDDDELDSYQVSPDTAPPTKASTAAGSSSKKKAYKDKAQTQIQPPRTQRLKERKAAGTMTQIKQEPDGDDSTNHEQKAATTTRTGGRGSTLKPPAPRTTTNTTTAKTATGTGAKPRGRPPKTLASGSAAAPTTSSQADDSEEKENAPGGSGNGSDESKDEPVTKIRVSRRAGAANAGAAAGSGKSVKSAATGRVKTASKPAVVKTEEEDDGPVVAAATTGRARTTRVMRTRTKTG